MKPFFISIPHSGERVPQETPWLADLSEPILMCDVDRYVDQLYAPVVSQLKIACVRTQWHRYVVDLNRLPEDVDVDSVEGSANPSGKFTSGLHWVKTTRGQQILPKPMSMEQHLKLVKRYFDPFHEDVREVYAFFKEKNASKIYHLDAHSMPSMGTAAHRDPGQKRADIVISDQEGKSCEPWFKDLVGAAYKEAGLQVAFNWPYLGGRVTQTYGLPDQGQHAIQVEINRALYMDEETKKLLPEKAEVLKKQIALAINKIFKEIPEG